MRVESRATVDEVTSHGKALTSLGIIARGDYKIQSDRDLVSYLIHFHCLF